MPSNPVSHFTSIWKPLILLAEAGQTGYTVTGLQWCDACNLCPGVHAVTVYVCGRRGSSSHLKEDGPVLFAEVPVSKRFTSYGYEK